MEETSELSNLPNPMTEEEFRNVRLMVCTPMFGGQAYSSYISSVLDIKHWCMTKYRIPVEFMFICNQSLISAARNDLAATFLESKCTHMLFLDADVGFPGDQLGNMIAQNMDIAVGSYPKKAFNWDRVAEVVRMKPDLNSYDLATVAHDHAIMALGDSFKFDRPVEVSHAGTGLMLIKREAFTKWRDYHGDENRVYQFQGRDLYDFFQIGVDPRTKQYFSEDVYFCEKFREAGGHIWMLPWIQTVHEGTYRFQGNIPMMSILTDPESSVTSHNVTPEPPPSQTPNPMA